MAGIGFELKKLFRRKGLLAGLRAYGCAGILCTGPMLLGVLLQLGILVLCGWAGAAQPVKSRIAASAAGRVHAITGRSTVSVLPLAAAPLRPVFFYFFRA